MNEVPFLSFVHFKTSTDPDLFINAIGLYSTPMMPSNWIMGNITDTERPAPLRGENKKNNLGNADDSVIYYSFYILQSLR